MEDSQAALLFDEIEEQRTPVAPVAAPGQESRAEEGDTPDTGDWGITGHQRAITLLERSWAGGRLSHAFLLTGPAGVGKHALARAFVRFLNCQGAIRPCHRCGPCRRLAHGTFVDLQELVVERADDGKIKQGISVAQVREMTEQAVLPPMDGSYKCFVIREAELLTASGANALLKTLEEPPPHALFLLTAPTRDAVMTTIASRCQHLALAPVPDEEIAGDLVAQLGVEQEEAARLAALAAGSPGVAFTLATGEEARARYDEARAFLARAVQGDLVDRFEVADEVAKIWNSDRERGRTLLRQWTVLIQAALRGAAGGESAGAVPEGNLNAILGTRKLSELVRLLRSLERLPYRLDHMQPRVALEVLMLDLEATLAGAVTQD